MRSVLYAIAMGSVLSGIAPGALNAQPTKKQADNAALYPARPVRMIVPFAPGGGTDLIARLLAVKVGGTWGQTIVVDNRSGGGGTIGTATAAKAAPDGYTLLLSSVSIAYLPALYTKLPYDTSELAPVTLLVTQPSLLVVHPSIPAKSVTEFLALAKSKPGELRYSSGGSGSASHLAIELLRSVSRIDLVHVPYKGGGPAINSLLGGETHTMVSNVVTLIPHVKTGRMRALAVTGVNRAKLLPDLPTIAEAGVPGAEFDGWYGLLVTAGTPRAIVNRINTEFNRALEASEVRERFSDAGFEPLGGSPEKFATYMRAETKKWSSLVREANIKVE